MMYHIMVDWSIVLVGLLTTIMAALNGFLPSILNCNATWSGMRWDRRGIGFIVVQFVLLLRMFIFTMQIVELCLDTTIDVFNIILYKVDSYKFMS